MGFSDLVTPHVGFTRDSDTQRHDQEEMIRVWSGESLLRPYPDRSMAGRAYTARPLTLPLAGAGAAMSESHDETNVFSKCLAIRQVSDAASLSSHHLSP